MFAESTPSLEVNMGLEGKNYTDRNVDPTFILNFYTHFVPILHRFVTIHDAAESRDRQTAISTVAYTVALST